MTVQNAFITAGTSIISRVSESKYLEQIHSKKDNDENLMKKNMMHGNPLGH